ncbi:RNA 2',3'-cyclic phosphodiesterase [Paenibacillus glycanilyticus]|uniref:RNA 2',3'-cyclic phosphodiesterase n=1 Tax=Paenibacillus glycanilyticus TaxID=126569 RepID=A0ABQ6NPN2_9BACL|nr:RNA 2',3'-cyclic phosphodiesterase [Paenibacillus glycanilyticus]GMK46525.1 RNA 2',3'-cyclic phosphodiesterase [Paenibacillus glycanilyticus]
MADNIRIFTAISIPANISGQIVSHLPDWQDQLSFQKWVDPRDLHITLHFIGDMPVSSIPAIQTAMQEAVSRTSSFSLELSKLGSFGREERPSVLWLGLKQLPAELTRLHQSLGQSLHSGIGYTPETRLYRPHVTLARKYSADEPCTAEKLEKLSSPFLQHQTAFDITGITLYRTRLGERPMYEPIAVAQFDK